MLPEDPEENAIARQWVEDAETNGFRVIAYQLLREYLSTKAIGNRRYTNETHLRELIWSGLHAFYKRQFTAFAIG